MKKIQILTGLVVLSGAAMLAACGGISIGSGPSAGNGPSAKTYTCTGSLGSKSFFAENPDNAQVIYCNTKGQSNPPNNICSINKVTVNSCTQN